MFQKYFSYYMCCFKVQLIIFSFLFVGNSFAQWDTEGSFRARGIGSQIQSKEESSFLIQGRFYFKGEYRPNNKFKSQLQFLASNPHGAKFSFEENFRIYPFGSWLVNEDLELRFGRTTYENKFNQIISVNDYESFFHVFDGAFLEYNANIININFWGAYLPKRWVGIKQIQEFKYGFGFFLNIESISDYIDHFNIHVAYLGDSFFEKDSEKMSRYGFGLKGVISFVNLTYDFIVVGHCKGMQFKIDEEMYHFQLNYLYPDFFDSRIFVGYHTDSSEYKPWLYDHHENAGFLDLFLWGNLTYYFLGFSADLDSLFAIKVAFYDFWPKEEGSIRLGRFGSLFSTESKGFINSHNKVLGRELDVKVEKKIGKDFEIHLLAGLFIPRTASKSLFKEEGFYNNIQLTGFYKF